MITQRRLAFCVFTQFGGKELRDEDQTAESIKSQMTEREWEKVFEMSQDKNLYHNLCTSLFPTIHGRCRCKTSECRSVERR